MLLLGLGSHIVCSFVSFGDGFNCTGKKTRTKTMHVNALPHFNGAYTCILQLVAESLHVMYLTRT